jgi:protein SCO1
MLGPRRFVQLVLLLLTLACGERGGTDPLVAGPAAKRYPLTGTVVSVRPEERTLTVSHERVDGLMEAMTMTFPVKEQWVMRAAARGDSVNATLVVDGARSWIEGVVVTKGPVGSGGRPSSDASGAPAVGTPLPELALIDETGVRVSREDLLGRTTVLTFIYTRCPLPDYCPLMLQRFGEIAKAAAARPGLAARIQLVAVTVDPEYDTPAVLRAFAADRVPLASRGGVSWRFLTGDADNVRTFARFIGLEYFEERGQVMHALRTALIDPSGRVVRVFRGNEWKTEDVIDLM